LDETWSWRYEEEIVIHSRNESALPYEQESAARLAIPVNTGAMLMSAPDWPVAALPRIRQTLVSLISSGANVNFPVRRPGFPPKRWESSWMTVPGKEYTKLWRSTGFKNQQKERYSVCVSQRRGSKPKLGGEIELMLSFSIKNFCSSVNKTLNGYC
jgi:hypothetical protein